ncbi:MAG: hypothetical protein H6831_12680 [Planctomycetes bacterium]|nr:hypothetical protein [Planctomycetota bacterium]
MDECLPGCRWVEGQHRWHVYPPKGGAVFYLPQGEHGAGDRAEIERGHVRKMARQFGVLEEMKRALKGL